MVDKKIIIEEFGGVHEVYDDSLISPGASPNVEGFLGTEEDHLIRLGGNLCLADSATSNCKPIIDISQITFATSSYVLIHNSSMRELVETCDFNPYAVEKDGIADYGI